jgi:hypothetical protein
MKKTGNVFNYGMTTKRLMLFLRRCEKPFFCPPRKHECRDARRASKSTNVETHGVRLKAWRAPESTNVETHGVLFIFGSTGNGVKTILMFAIFEYSLRVVFRSENKSLFPPYFHLI